MIYRCEYHCCRKEIPDQSHKKRKAHFCSRKCMLRSRVAARRNKIKEIAVEYKGGKCEICGYNKCIAALEFHHRNKEEKEFSIATDGLTRSWERIKIEVDKCDLLCANCHREVEYSEKIERLNKIKQDILVEV